MRHQLARLTSPWGAPFYRQGTQGQRGEGTHPKPPSKSVDRAPTSALMWGHRSGLCPEDGPWNAKLGQRCLQKTEWEGDGKSTGNQVTVLTLPCDLKPLCSLTSVPSPVKRGYYYLVHRALGRTTRDKADQGLRRLHLRTKTVVTESIWGFPDPGWGTHLSHLYPSVGVVWPQTTQMWD